MYSTARIIPYLKQGAIAIERAISEEYGQIASVLRAHHRATATKDVKLLRSLFAQEGQFIGTDDMEVWTADKYANCLEGTESGWDMMEYSQPSIDLISVAPYGYIATFFEVVRHAKYGLMRGSGTVVKKGPDWKIIQYVLSFSVPNHVVDNTNILELLAS